MIRPGEPYASDAFEQERRLFDYLLGRLPPRERAEIDGRLFTEEGLNDEMLATVDDMIHAYLNGTLSPEERTLFEAGVLASPRHKERLAFMKHLLSAVDHLPVEDHGLAGAAATATGAHRRRLLAAAAVLVALGVVVGLALRRGERPPARAAVGAPSPASTLASPSAGPSAPQHPPAEVTAIHRVRLPVRPAAPVDIALAAQTHTVRLELDVREQRPGFDAVIRTAGGTPVWRARGLPPADPGRPLVLTVPADVLGSGRYRLTIEEESFRDSTRPRPLIFEYDLRVSRPPQPR